MTKNERRIAYFVLMVFLTFSVAFVCLFLSNMKNVEKYKYLSENGWEVTGTIIGYETDEILYMHGNLHGNYRYYYIYSIQYTDDNNADKIYFKRIEVDSFDDKYGDDMLNTSVSLYLDDRGSVLLAEEVGERYIREYWFWFLGTVFFSAIIIIVVALFIIIRKKPLKEG